MGKFQSIRRRISMSQKYATEQKFDDVKLQADGWRLANGDWTRIISVVQFVHEEHRDCGQPDVGTPSLSETLEAVRYAVTTENLPTDVLMKALNNGLYLLANQAAKPRAASTSKAALEKAKAARLATMQATYLSLCVGKKALAMFTEFQEAVVGGKLAEFLESALTPEQKPGMIQV